MVCGHFSYFGELFKHPSHTCTDILYEKEEKGTKGTEEKATEVSEEKGTEVSEEKRNEVTEEKASEVSEEKGQVEKQASENSATGSGTYRYDEATGSWQLKTSADGAADSTSATNVFENEYYRWCGETQKWIPKMTDVVAETEHFRWDANKKEWVPKVNEAQNSYGIDEDGQTVYKDKDGVVYFWDVERKAWFPKIDDDMLARYQMSYGFTETNDETSTTTTAAAAKIENEKLAAAEAIKKQKQDELESSANAMANKKKPTPAWFQIDPEHNTKVYVTNLPLDMTLDEFAELMGKCGMITRDPDTQKYKIKLYAEANGQLKGDGLCDYIKVESVELALNILDEYEYRGHKLSVQRAKFQMRGDYNPSLKPKRRKKDKEKIKKIKEK